MVVKAYVLPAQRATFCSFSEKIPCRGSKSQIVKQKIKKAWVEKELQPYPLPLIFIKPEILSSISQKIRKKPIELEIDIEDILNFNSFKNYLINLYTK